MSAALLKGAALLARVETYLNKYLTFPSQDFALTGALWASVTYLWPHFDCLPYLVITSETKRSGKTRFSELLQALSANPQAIAGATAPTVFHMIRDESPTLFIDEAEGLNSESNPLRELMNIGYRKGQTIPRMGKGGVVDRWPAFCPKCFILIGDVYATLHDRAIILRMVRGTAPERFSSISGTAEGNDIGTALQEFINERKDAILDAYADLRLEFLSDRDEEIWLPVFAMCKVLAPERMTELSRVATDLCADKTSDRRKEADMKGIEAELDAAEYSERLLADMKTIIDGKKYILTNDALPALLALPTAPWRKYRGKPLDEQSMSTLLRRFHVTPRNIKVKPARKGDKATVRKGYLLEEVDAAIKRNEV